MFSYKIDYGIVVAQMEPYVALGTCGIPLKNNAYVSVPAIYMYVIIMHLISYHLVLFKCTLNEFLTFSQLVKKDTQEKTVHLHVPSLHMDRTVNRHVIVQMKTVIMSLAVDIMLEVSKYFH